MEPLTDKFLLGIKAIFQCGWYFLVNVKFPGTNLNMAMILIGFAAFYIIIDRIEEAITPMGGHNGRNEHKQE